MSVDRQALRRRLERLSVDLNYADDEWGTQGAVREQLEDCAQAVVELVEVVREIKAYQRTPEYAWTPRKMGDPAPQRVVIRCAGRGPGGGRRWVVTMPSAVAYFLPDWASEPCICASWSEALLWACGALKYATREADMQRVGPPIA